jgi:hypothetical protein
MLFPKLYKDASMCAPGIRLWIRKTLGLVSYVWRGGGGLKKAANTTTCAASVLVDFDIKTHDLNWDSERHTRLYWATQKRDDALSWVSKSIWVNVHERWFLWSVWIRHKTLVFPLVSLKTFSTITATKNWSSSLLWKCSKVQRCTRHELVSFFLVCIWYKRFGFRLTFWLHTLPAYNQKWSLRSAWVSKS